MSPLVLTFGLLVGIAALLVPKLVSQFRLARGVERDLRDERLEPAVDMARIPDYHCRVAAGLTDDALADVIDDATWNDLHLEAVLTALDRTVSQIGRQYLYHVLRTPLFSREALEQREAATQRFARDTASAAFVREALRPLANPSAAHCVALLFDDLPRRPRLWWLFPLLTAAAIGCLVLIVVWPQAALVWLAVCVANVAVQLYYRPRIRPIVAALQAIPALIRVAERLRTLEPDGIADEVATLRDGAADLALLRRTTSWLLFEPGTASDFAATVYEYVNLFFLLDINAFVFSTQRVSRSRPLLRRMFESIGHVDAAQSIARWRPSLPHWTTPELHAPAKSLQAENLFHPLLAHPVANSIEVQNTSVLITGSNMAGKTTFMRTLGVNAILALTVHTVCAHHWRAPLLRVRSSIGRADSLLDGKSHYLAEVESVLSLINAKRDGRQHLFLLDEMFRGTNTAERVAAAYAVLVYLTRGMDIAAVATHDLELVPMLGASFASSHFRESIVDDALSFDFVLRHGQSSAHNAIALLKVMRYPDAIVQDALSVLERP